MKFLINLTGAIIGVFVGAIMVFFIGLIMLNTNIISFGDATSLNTSIISTSKNNATDVYENSSNSVITVINKQSLSVNNAILQQYIDSLTDGSLVESGVGSGFVYKKENGYYYALTNYHVVENSDEVGVLTTQGSKNSTDDTAMIDATIVGEDPTYDIAVIKFKTSQNIEPLDFSNSDDITVGQDVYAIGSPYGKEFYGSITSGIISAPIRTVTDDSDTDLKYIQTDASINPGNSGGPLLNSDGQVIGMNSMKIAGSEADNMGFAIPSNVLIEIANNIEEQSASSTDDSSSFNFEDELNKLKDNQ